MEANSSFFQDAESTTLNYTSNFTTFEQNMTFVNTTTRKSQGVSMFYPIIITEMVLSIVGLILTILVYSILPEFRNVHGKNLITLSSCLLTAFSFLILDLLLRHHISSSFCFVISLTIHVTFLATFFWTNVMAFDIWRTMSDLKPKKEIKTKSKKYWKYSIYAWTATILTAIPAIVFDKTDSVPEDYRPKFGISRCWLSGPKAFAFYFNLPVGIILFSNLVMFMLTTRSLLLIKKMTERLHVKQQQQRFHLYLKLFLVMGIIWMTEFLPWATGIYKLYAMAGILTALHGILLFVIFVCKRRILCKVRDKLKIYCHCSTDMENKSSVSQPTLSSASTASISNSKV